MKRRLKIENSWSSVYEKAKQHWGWAGKKSADKKSM